MDTSTLLEPDEQLLNFVKLIKVVLCEHVVLRFAQHDMLTQHNFYIGLIALYLLLQ